MAITIAIDPGHGGGNSGLTHNGLIEKHITRITAQAMKEELETYEGVTAIITDPDEEVDMSLKERAQTAKDAGADVLVSLHFNMSEQHTMFGSEVWIPSKGLKHADMRSLGDIFLEQFSDIGLTIRGTKVRLNDRGTDYYGILRESVALDMPAILVEHCYADHAQDEAYMQNDDNFRAFGKMDAEAVAKYYHLKSSDGTKDFTKFVKNGYFAPEETAKPDKTGPEAVSISWLQDQAHPGETEAQTSASGADGTTEQAAEQELPTTPDGRVRTTDVQRYHIQGNEPETDIVYYEYSLDGGESWSGLMPFAKGETQMDIDIPGVMPGDKVVARLYNGYTVSGTSNTITYKDPPPVDPIEADRDIASLTAAYESSQKNYELMNKYYRYSLKWSNIGLVLTALCVIGFVATVFEGARFAKTDKQDQLRERQKNAQDALAGSLPDAVSSGNIKDVLTNDISALDEKRARRERRRKKARFARLSILWLGAAIFLFLGALAPKALLENAAGEANAAMDAALTSRKNAEEINKKHDEIRAQQEKDAKELIMTDAGIVEGEYVPKTEQETTVIYDIAKGYMRVPLLDIEKNPYDLSAFTGENLQKNYVSSDGRKATIGIDVSKFQGEIDWPTVAASGVKFVIIRLGSRAYGSGDLIIDDKFIDNIEGASLAGIKVGVYFFSTALNDKEAVEEADFVIKSLQGYAVDMPVVFDTEIITYDKARNADMTPNQLTSATKAFCDRIAAAGLKPMIYANAKRFCTVLHLEELEGYAKWLADYRATPDYPYTFSVGQLAETGSVPGIEVTVDIDLCLDDW